MFRVNKIDQQKNYDLTSVFFFLEKIYCILNNNNRMKENRNKCKKCGNKVFMKHAINVFSCFTKNL